MLFSHCEGRVLERSSTSIKSPSGLHELHEVVIVVNRGRHSGVVIIPLGSCDSAVSVLVAEVGEELKENLILGQLTVDDLRVE